MFDINDIVGHCYNNTLIRKWHCYYKGPYPSNGLTIEGIFNDDEFMSSGYRYYTICFGEVEECNRSLSDDEFKGALIESITVTALSGYNIKLCMIADTEQEICFRCGKIHVGLQRYLGVSFNNVYGTEAYNKEVNEHLYVEKKAFLKYSKEYTLPDDFSIEIKVYSDADTSAPNKYIVKADLMRGFLKNKGRVIYDYVSIYANQPIYREWIMHRNGHRYYPFHINLYGISIIDVDTCDVFHYIPQGYDNNEEMAYGESFIITDVHYDMKSNLIAYGGCYWAESSDVKVGDFSQPLGFNPRLVSIHDIVDPDYEKFGDIDFVGWEEKNLIIKAASTEKEYRIPIETIINKLTVR